MQAKNNIDDVISALGKKISPELLSINSFSSVVAQVPEVNNGARVHPDELPGGADSFQTWYLTLVPGRGDFVLQDSKSGLRAETLDGIEIDKLPENVAILVVTDTPIENAALRVHNASQQGNFKATDRNTYHYFAPHLLPGREEPGVSL
ncbi:MAG: hypothetical protein KDI13_05330 [Alphaproteobacteria bacterium]|nr:hypothetical protein [Alphaproteobacteria bacterium]